METSRILTASVVAGKEQVRSLGLAGLGDGGRLRKSVVVSVGTSDWNVRKRAVSQVVGVPTSYNNLFGLEK